MPFNDYSLPQISLPQIRIKRVDGEESEDLKKKPKLEQEDVEREQEDQNLPSKLATDLSQAIYYATAESKLNDSALKKQLREWLFERFPSENRKMQTLRDSIITEVMSKLNELQKASEKMPNEWDEYNDARVTLLTRAVVKISAEVVIRGDQNEAFKLEMLRSFLKD